MLYWISYGKTQSCQDAEECVQETFFYVAKHFEKIGDVNSSQTKGYLATIVTGFSIDVYNKSKNTASLILKITTWRKIYRILIISEPLSFLLQLKACLARKKKIYIYLKYVYGYKSTEIAEIYNVTDISVRKNLKEPKRN